MTKTRSVYKKRAIPAQSRRDVAVAAGAIPGETTEAACSYCGAVGKVYWPKLRTGKPGAWVSLVDLEFDHVFPEFHGGRSVPENIVLACRKCNRTKRDKVL